MDVQSFTTKVTDALPLTQAAKDLINKVNIKVDSTLGGSGRGVAVTTGAMAHSLDKSAPLNITVKSLTDPNSETYLSHEIFNSIFSDSGINPVEFNKAWEAAKAGPENANNEIGALENQLNDSKNQSVYNAGQNGENTKTSPYDLATERFATMGRVFGKGGLSEIPASLQKYYSAYLK